MNTASYYVWGSNGNDSWSGLLAAPNAARTDGPFQTLTRAQAALRSSATKKVSLRAGTYAIASGLALTSQDNGETWMSYPGETATLDGGGTGKVTLTGVQAVVLQGLTWQNLGVKGLAFDGGQAVALRWNTFLNCNQACISGGALTNSIIDSNTLNGQSPGNPPGNTSAGHAAMDFNYGSSNNQITHNLIENCQGGAIAFAGGPTDPPDNNNLIDRNLLRNVGTNVVDFGAIYFYEKSHSSVGNKITNNIIDGNGGTDYRTNGTKSIYLDDGVSNVIVFGNVCHLCGQFAWQIHGGDHNMIVNNIFDLSSPGTSLGIYQTVPDSRDYGMAENIVMQNIVYFAGTPPASLYQININPEDAMPSLQNNLYYSADGFTIPNGLPVADSHPVYTNPGFSWVGTKYSLSSSSNAYNLIGFQRLPTDQGPQLNGPIRSNQIRR